MNKLPIYLSMAIILIISASALDYKAEIRNKARELGSGQSIELWVHNNIKYETTESRGVKNVYDIWNTRTGDCSEIAVLTCAMIKELKPKIKCYTVYATLKDVDGTTVKHAWAEFEGHKIFYANFAEYKIINKRYGIN